MAEVIVESAGADLYRVTVREASGSTTHEVTVDPGEAARLAGDTPVERLVEASFRFLLDREPKESILRRFELPVISRYFPEYESRIADYL